MDPIHNDKCRARHIGTWAVEPNWFRQAVKAVNDGVWVIQPEAAADDEGRPLFSMDTNGVATIAIEGQMQKGDSKFGGTNTLRVRRAIREAVQDGDVRAILVQIDSPGGTVAGTADLADDIRAADAQKPVYVHVEDMAASAGLWVAVQGRRVTANRTAEIGSIGVFAVVDDSSEMFARDGVKVHVISTGPHKGAFVEGAEVTDEQLTELQSVIDGLGAEFNRAIARGRNLPIDSVRAVADGRTFLAGQAKELGLIDDVTTLDAARAQIRRDLRQANARAQRALRLRSARLGADG